jgi:hypothetical protein
MPCNQLIEIMTPEISQWSCETARNMMLALCDKMPDKRIFGPLLSQLTYR